MSKTPKSLTTSIIVEKFVPGGFALGKISDPSLSENNKKIFLWNALPGEIISRVLITKAKSSYLEGVAEVIDSPSPLRVSPKDPCFLSTSPWQILKFSSELEQKRLLVEESLREQKIPLETEVKNVVTDGAEWNYRNKMEYALYWDKESESISLAFHARGSHKKVPIESSSIERPEILARAKEIISRLNESHEPAYKYQSLLLRSNKQGIVSGGLLENNHPHPSFTPLTDTLLKRSYSYSPNGFFQINLSVYELALKQIKSHIKTSNILDLYSGVGTIGLSVAEESNNLTLVETNNDAFKELEKNCEKRTNARPVHAKSEEALSYISPDQTVILDPPRAGCDKRLIEKLLEVRPKSIIYLSCNPSTQARDLSFLVSTLDSSDSSKNSTSGSSSLLSTLSPSKPHTSTSISTRPYKITSITPFNFFPKTPHIENLVVLELQ
ncbi:class I SAM-dependent RNA methyltransferase [Candidatus Saccharibacteria bacterium]|nr:class I SAM-dependent RNA methyltransferase [Candidatus Saccharibacteria bacterium]